jgi:hypothetical protein
VKLVGTMGHVTNVSEAEGIDVHATNVRTIMVVAVAGPVLLQRFTLGVVP